MTAIGLYTNGRYTGNAEPIRQGQTISSQFLQWDGSAPFFRLGFFPTECHAASVKRDRHLVKSLSKMVQNPAEDLTPLTSVNSIKPHSVIVAAM